jgi:hypothetical protein
VNLPTVVYGVCLAWWSMWVLLTASTEYQGAVVAAGLQASAALGACVISSRFTPGGVTRGAVAAAAVLAAGWVLNQGIDSRAGPHSVSDWAYTVSASLAMIKRRRPRSVPRERRGAR